MIVLIACDNDLTSPTTDSTQTYTEVIERSFTVGDSSTLTLANFVGNITIRPGRAGTIRVAATKKAANQSELAQINVEMTMQGGSLNIKSDNPSNLENVSVDFNITIPLGTQVDLNTGVGNIDYKRRPSGINRFITGVGSITLTLPADINIRVDLETGVGSINVDFTVVGNVSNQRITGTIGSGQEGRIRARTGVGDIILNSQ